jgi:lysophospholipase L1-like esterase
VTRRGLLPRLGLSGLGVLLAAAVAEIALRLAGGGDVTMSRGMLHVFDPEAGFRCPPGLELRHARPGDFDVLVRCNARGLRDRDHSFRKPEGAKRLLCFGDSFMWGYGVENDEMLSSRLEALLPGFETVNFGVIGYTAVQELVRLESEGLDYEPDWALVLFCDNDLDGNFDDRGGRRPIVVPGADGSLKIGNRPVSVPFGADLVPWLHRHSRLVVEVHYRVELLRTAFAARAAAAASPAPPAQSETDPSTMQFSGAERFLEPDARVDLAWSTVERIYARMRDLLAARGARMIAAYAPERALVLDSAYDEFLAATGADPARADRDRARRRFAQMCDSIGIPHADLIAAFRAAPDPAALFHVQDGHWNRAGHALAAEVIARRLLEILAASSD